MIRDLAGFAYYMLRPRAMRAWWRLGFDGLEDWSWNWHLMRHARMVESNKAMIARNNARIREYL